jgi:hypothetical protein
MKRFILAVVVITGTTGLAADRPVPIGHLETRGCVITIWAGAQPSYTVHSTSGKTLAERLSLREFNAKFPELRRAVDGSFATWAGL